MSEQDEAAAATQTLKAGWGVLRVQPWHLAGVFAASVDAENLARSLGEGYVVKYGERSGGARDFVFENSSNG